MKNKKIISLLCALAMIFSMFSAFTVVNAAGEKGIKLEGTLSKDLTEVTIKATAENAVGALQNAAVSFTVPDGVTEEDITFVADSGFAMAMGGLDGTTYTLALVDTSGKGVTPTAELATIKIKFASPITTDFVVTLSAKAGFEDTEGAVSVEDGMAATSITINNPNKKPDTVERPTEDTTEEPDVPTPVDPVGKGISLEVALDKTNTILTIKATAENTVGALQNAAVSFTVPDGVTEEDITFVADSGFAMAMGGLDGTTYTLALVDTSGKGVTPTAELATIQIKLPAVATSPVAVVLSAKAGLEDTEGAVSVEDGMTATTAVATPAGDEFTGKTTPLKNYVGSGYEAAINAVADGTDVYLTVDVKKADGTEATYGVDYVANYNGKQLTAKEYNNLIHGYTDADMVDVINGLTFTYTTDAKTISTTLNAVGAESQLVDPVTDKAIDGTTPVVKNPTIKAADVKATVDKNFNVVATVTNAKTNPVVTFEIVKDSKGTALGENDESAIQMYGTDDISKTVALKDGKYTQKFTANKVGTAYVKVSYVDDEGNEASDVAKVTVSKETISSDKNDSSSSNNNNTSGTGPIAGPGVNNNGGFVPVTFIDLGSVPWAQEAILALANKGVVSGRGDGTFDPDANITRAEYCQILIGAIEKNNEYADVTFDDVDTNAWYYHAVAVASKLGIVEGYGDGNFGPYDLITRQDMALMTYKAAKVMNKNLASDAAVGFTDADQISDYAKTAVNTLANSNIISGMGDGTFAPKNNATRAQAAVILYTTFIK